MSLADPTIKELHAGTAGLTMLRLDQCALVVGTGWNCPGRTAGLVMTLEKTRGAALNLRKPVKVFDFFAGCGGASAGLRAAGLEIALGLDNDIDAARTFQANFAEAEFVCADIEDVPVESLDRIVDRWIGHPLLFNACAPCQLFSRQRRGTTAPDDGRLALLNHLLPFVRRYQPELVFAENVPGLRDGNAGRKVFLSFTRELQALGYRTNHQVVRSQDYGVPQRRARLVLLASRLGRVEFPMKTHGPGTLRPTYATVADWIGKLPEISAGATHPLVPNHQAAGLSPLNLQRIRATPPGGGWRDLPDHLLPASRKSGFAGFTDVYGRLQWNSQAPALTTRCISYSNGRFGHPSQDRAISVREAASLQTFPLDFLFTGSLNSQARQVGNAVPVLLAEQFGTCFVDHLAAFTREPDSRPTFDPRATTRLGLGQQHG